MQNTCILNWFTNIIPVLENLNDRIEMWSLIREQSSIDMNYDHAEKMFD